MFEHCTNSMPRPSLNIDQTLLASGRELFARHGCSGLTVRLVAEHAGVNPSLFHYHFGSKEQFLRTLLQNLYEEMFTQLSGAAQLPGPPLQRLRAVLLFIGGFLRTHGSEVGRIWGDAGQGESVAVEFVRNNAPRHLALLTSLLAEAEQAGDLRPMPALQRLVFLMGAVAAPVLVAGRLQSMELGSALPIARLGPDVLSDAAIAARADMAILALQGREELT
jgi:AcrR family transcriptional regulator